MLRISLRTNSLGSSVNISATWLYRPQNWFTDADAISICEYGMTGDSVSADVYLKCWGSYPRAVIEQVSGDHAWILVNSYEAHKKDGTNYITDTDKSYECYQSLAEAQTKVLGAGKAYTLIVNGTDMAIAAQASSVKNNLTINGKTYNGSSAINVGAIGAAYGGSGKTNLMDSANAYLNSLSIGSGVPTDNDYFISQYVNGGTTTTTYHRRPVSALYSYIQNKTDNRYIKLTGGTITGDLKVNGTIYLNNIALSGLTQISDSQPTASQYDVWISPDETMPTSYLVSVGSDEPTEEAYAVWVNPDIQMPEVYLAKYIRKMSLSIPTSLWTGSGPYTAIISRDDVTTETWCDINLDSVSLKNFTTNLAWSTDTAGKIVFTTTNKPTGTISGTIILIEVKS